MNNTYTTLDKYFDTLTKTGYLPISAVEGIFIQDFLEELTKDPDYLISATCEQQEIACKLYECLTRNNCLL